MLMKSMIMATVLLFAAIAVRSGKESNPKVATVQHCDYCKADFPETHFPCVLKAVNGRINTRTGRVEFASGQAIGGVAVKIAKNDIDSITLTSQANGEVELNHMPEGNYKLRIMLPAINPKSELTGRGMAGIIARIGKKPAKLLLPMITDANGEMLLNNLEAGDYILTLKAPTDLEKNSDLYRSYRFDDFNPNFKRNK